MGPFTIIFFTILAVALFIICVICTFRNDGRELFEEFVDGLFEFYDTLIQDE
jgi:hypothetical protein